MAGKQVKENTADSILSMSRELFNRYGVQAVSAHNIARELEISSGNLTYHFKKKSDIILALLDQLELAITSELARAPQLAISVGEQAGIALGLLKTFWCYRFYFNDILHISSAFPATHNKYKKLKKATQERIFDAIDSISAAGAAKQMPSRKKRGLMADNLWYLWLSYLRLYQLETPESRISEQDYCRQAALHMYNFLEPYYEESVKKGFYDYIVKNA